MCGGLQSGPQFLTSHELDETILLELHPMNFSNTWDSLSSLLSISRIQPVT